jgi:predicted ATPase with chaperone activity
MFGGGLVGGPSYQYRITDAGRQRALLFLEQSHYVGAAPVPLPQYQAYMRTFQDGDPHAVSIERTRQAFSHLILTDEVLNQIGLAVTSGHSIFVYGPPGNGKTVIAQAIRNLLEGEIAIPRALEVEGQIIKLFDPVNHEAIAIPENRSVLSSDDHDARWVRCRRPMVMVGGELTLEALDLTYSPSAGFYAPPIQLLANGGVLVIDDFGRQHVAPRDLLNRWIVPLESRVDFLTLATGQKFDVPFSTMVVFATNIKPSDLVDEAFLRRVRNKILAKSPGAAEFKAIWAQCCLDRDIHYDETMVDRLIEGALKPRGIVMRACQPRDLIDQALAYAAYVGGPRQLTPELLEIACASYFVDENEHTEA